MREASSHSVLFLLFNDKLLKAVTALYQFIGRESEREERCLELAHHGALLPVGGIEECLYYNDPVV